jgi:hypothetical protein
VDWQADFGAIGEHADGRDFLADEPFDSACDRGARHAQGTGDLSGRLAAIVLELADDAQVELVELGRARTAVGRGFVQDGLRSECPES